MNKKEIQSEYNKYKPALEELQSEAEVFVKEVVNKHLSIDINEVKQRPGGEIKSLNSIEDNLDAGKYEDKKHFLEIKDLSGLRVTCYCEDDFQNFGVILEGELKQKYSNVEREDKGGDANTGKSRPPYRAIHITFTKSVDHGGKTVSLPCEIQIRSILGNAWADLDRKYVYGKKVEGGTHELTDGVSTIMNGCEKIWTVVKKQSQNGDESKAEKDISGFVEETERTLSLVKTVTDKTILSKRWFEEHQSRATEGMAKLGIRTFMEIKAEVPNFHETLSLKSIRDAASRAPIETFGWPIGAFIDSRSEFQPKPDTRGIHAEISINKADLNDRTSYDYWAISNNASFYLKKSLFEDVRKPTHIFFDTRIVRITETLMYLHRLYNFLGVPLNTTIVLTITHSGIKGRVLNAANGNRELYRDYKTETDEVATTIETTLDGIEKDIVSVVEPFTKELFEQFEFFELERHVLEEMVITYSKGRMP